MMYCEQCLHILPDGTLFCDQCGTSALRHTSLGLVSPGAESPTTPPQLPATDMTPATPIMARGRPNLTVVADDSAIQVMAPTQESQNALMRHRLRLRLTNGKVFDLVGKTTYLIGRRDPQLLEIPDIDLTEWNGAACGVSRRHAALHINGDGIFIEDLESLNETIRNGFRLLPRQRYPLKDGDELRLGSITLIFAIL